MPATQSQREIAIDTPLGEDVLLLARMTGYEELGRPFEYQLELLSENHEIPLKDLIGQNVTVRLEMPQQNRTRYFNGFVSRFAHVGARERFAVYHAEVRPWIWLLTRTSDCRIFQDLSVPDIIKTVFRDFGFTDFEESLSGQYDAMPYIVQYRETSFDFVTRLMEREGIYYYFKHENGKHKLMLADGQSSHTRVEDCKTVRYFPRDDGTRRIEEHIYAWQVTQELRSGSVALNDYDFVRPRAPMETRAAIAREHALAQFELYDYPGAYASTSVGERNARLRIEQEACRHELATGRMDARPLGVGDLVEMIEYPRQDQNREYLIVSARHHLFSDEFGTGGGSDEPYDCEFTVIESKQPYRLTSLTEIPEISGPQTATVVGKAGEEIWTDEHGRVKVQFHWDRYGSADENSSCWIRVSEAWSGKGYGTVFLPRIGQEVIVEFLEGDPDQPVITGRLFNGLAKHPYALPGSATMSTIKTLSSKGGSGFNEIRFEDKADSEQIFIHAQKDMDVRVLNDGMEWTGNNHNTIIKNNHNVHVENNQNIKIDNDVMTEIGKDLHTKISGKEAKQVTGSVSLKVDGDVIEKLGAKLSTVATGDIYLKGMNVVIEGSGGLTIKCGSSYVVCDASGVTIKGSMVTVDGSMVKIASGPGSPAGTGQAGSPVSPSAPEAPVEADDAEPGEILEIKKSPAQIKAMEPGSHQCKPFKPPKESDSEKTWIEIKLVDEQGDPVPGEKYEVKVPDGTLATGTLDEKGYAKISGIDPGTCDISFPNLDKQAWSKKA